MGRVAGRGYLAYGTAKAALAHYTRLAAQDLEPDDPGQRDRRRQSVMTSALEFVASDEATMDEMTSKTPLRAGRRGRGHRRGGALPGQPAPAASSPARCSRSTAACRCRTSTSACPTSRPARDVTAGTPPSGSSPGRPAPSAGTRSPASTPAPTSSWSGSGSPTRTRSARTPASSPASAASSGVVGHQRQGGALRPRARLHRAHRDGRRPDLRGDRGPHRDGRARHQRRLQRAGAAAATRDGARPRRDASTRSTRPARRPAPACTSTASTPASPTTCCRWR